MTSADAALIANLPGWAFAFVLLLCRTGGAIMLMPGSGEAEVPVTIRAGIAVAVTALLLPGLAADMPQPPSEVWRVLAMVVAELLTGLFIGWLARLVVTALSVAGQFIAIVTGLASVLQPDAVLGPQGAVVGRLFGLSATVLGFATGLYALPLAAIAGSYRAIPAGTLLPAGDTSQAMLAATSGMFAVALRLAAPFVLAGIVFHMALSLLSRMVPQLQVFFLAAPAQLLVGIALLGLLSTALLGAWQEWALTALGGLPGAQSLGP